MGKLFDTTGDSLWRGRSKTPAPKTSLRTRVQRTNKGHRGPRVNLGRRRKQAGGGGGRPCKPKEARGGKISIVSIRKKKKEETMARRNEGKSSK